MSFRAAPLDARNFGRPRWIRWLRRSGVRSPIIEFNVHHPDPVGADLDRPASPRANPGSCRSARPAGRWMCPPVVGRWRRVRLPIIRNLYNLIVDLDAHPDFGEVEHRDRGPGLQANTAQRRRVLPCLLVSVFVANWRMDPVLAFRIEPDPVAEVGVVGERRRRESLVHAVHMKWAIGRRIKAFG